MFQDLEKKPRKWTVKADVDEGQMMEWLLLKEQHVVSAWK